nr:olfactory receptor 134 [Microplitis mediator]
MLLPYSFGILQCLGLWQTTERVSRWKIYLYIIHKNLMIMFIYSCVLFELIALIASFDDLDEFINNLIVLLTMVGVCGKIANVISKRKEILRLINILETYPCLCQNPEEKCIQDEFDKTIKLRTIAYFGLTESAVAMVVSVSILCDTPNRSLPFKTWLPFDSKTFFGYWTAYNHQILAHVFGALVNVAYDTLIPGLMLKICAQLSILEYRLKSIPKKIYSSDLFIDVKRREINEISKCVIHHLKIFQFAEITNKVFSSVIFLQFSISAIVICVTVYKLSQIEINNPEFGPMAFYFTCMLSQVFVICFASSECNLKSYDIAMAVYQTDWYILSVSSQKSLLFIMMRSLRPLKFTAGYFIDVSLNSYNQLVKLSYSAYNVLQ